MLIRKLYNLRKDLTEVRNNTRNAIDAFGEIKGKLARISRKTVTRSFHREVVLAEFSRRDIWQRAEAETERLAGGRPVWAIKCPDTESRLKMDIAFRSDYAYCMTLKKALEKEGIYAVVQLYDDWYCDVGADVELLMGGKRDYHPDRRVRGRKNVMWIVCHPENVTGGSMAEIEPFLVPADTDIFYRDDSPVTYERVFVGHCREDTRNCVKWCRDNKIELDVWGVGWEKYYENDPYIHLHGVIPYDETADIYRKSKIIINDHHPEMRRTGMINDRCMEVLLCGKTMLCDWSQGVEDEFGDLFTYYHDETDFIEALRKAEDNYERLCSMIDERYEELVEKYGFSTEIKRLIEIVESVQGE